MRIRVSDVLELFAAGLSTEEILAEMPDLERDDILACLQFAARRFDHPTAGGMIFWIDAQLSPLLARWLTTTSAVEAHAVRELDLRDAEDSQIFRGARDARAVVITKDKDFVQMVERLGAPPQVLWLTCGTHPTGGCRRS